MYPERGSKHFESSKLGNKLRCVVGLVNCVAPMVLSETAPHQYRGAFGTIHQLSATIGIFLSSVFGMPNLLG